MPKTLLVPLDGSEADERAIPVAGELSRRLDAYISLVAARSGASSPPATYLGAVASFAGIPGVRREVVESVGLADALRAVGDDSNDPAISMANVEPALVALATHGRTGMARVVIGSVATAVVRGCRCPPLVVRPEPEVLLNDRS